MRATTIISGLVASLALIAAPLGAADREADQTVGDKNAKTLSDVPMAARDGLLKAAEGREITSVDRTEDQGKEVYQAKIRRDGKDLRIKVDESGSVVWRSDESAGGSQSGAWTKADSTKYDTKDQAKADAEKAKAKSDKMTADADKTQRDADKAQRDADKAQRDIQRKTDQAKRDAEKAKTDAERKAEQAKTDAEHKASDTKLDR